MQSDNDKNINNEDGFMSTRFNMEVIKRPEETLWQAVKRTEEVMRQWDYYCTPSKLEEN